MDASDAEARTSARDMPAFSGCADELRDWVMTNVAAAQSGCALAVGQKRYGNSIGRRSGGRQAIDLMRAKYFHVRHQSNTSFPLQEKFSDDRANCHLFVRIYAKMPGCSFFFTIHKSRRYATFARVSKKQ
ncbi:hypothetical protein [Herbaspirillum robiniae]|uniref:hypothetical protein n=1 Tax=Herbaspirillum robiniae TaxID=2014887 RepID=UPI003D7709D2